MDTLLKISSDTAGNRIKNILDVDYQTFIDPSEYLINDEIQHKAVSRSTIDQSWLPHAPGLSTIRSQTIYSKLYKSIDCLQKENLIGHLKILFSILCCFVADT